MSISSAKALFKSTTATFILRISGVGLGFITQAVLARLMGSAEYGEYIYACTWISLLGLLSVLGADSLLIRFCAAYSAQKQWGLLRGLLQRCVQIVLAASLLISLIGMLCVKTMTEVFNDKLALVFSVGFLLLPIQSIGTLRQAALQGLKRVTHGLLAELSGRPILLGLALLAYFSLDHHLDALDAMFLTLASGLWVFAIGSYWLWRALPPLLHSHAPIYANPSWIKTALPLLLLSVMRTVLSQNGIILTGLMIDAKAAGIYAVAARIAELPAFGLQASNAVLAPIISELHVLNKKTELQSVITRSARGVFLFTLIIVTPLIALREFILSLFGMEFIAGGEALLILLVGQTANALTGSVGLLMSMTGHQKQASKIIFGTLVINFVMNFTLIPRLGLEGAAIASAATTIFWNFIMYCFTLQRMKINSMAFKIPVI
jgi:O-antigen/teichoic acid export membrane protein